MHRPEQHSKELQGHKPEHKEQHRKRPAGRKLVHMEPHSSQAVEHNRKDRDRTSQQKQC